MLTELRALASHPPQFGSPWSSPEEQQWLGKLSALLELFDGNLAFRVTLRIGNLGNGRLHAPAVAEIMATLHQAIAKLEYSGVAQQGQHAFGPGAVYDFFKALKDLISTSMEGLLIIDPYLDACIFDYLTAANPSVKVRLLFRHGKESLAPALSKFNAQTGMNIEARTASAIHDRVIFVDNRSCYVLGQSIKDAAKRMPTYLAPLALDTVPLKQDVYESIWRSAAPVN